MVDPSERLQAWISDQGLTQAKAAAKLGCSRVFVTMLLGRRRRPGLRIAMRLEELTEAWEKGPIRASEWLTDEAEAA